MYVYNNVVKGNIMTNKNSNPFKNEDVIKDENKEAVSEENLTEEETAEEASEEVQDKKENDKESKLQEEYDKLNQQYIRLAADFEKALESVEDCEKVKESFNLVHKQVIETLAKLGLEEINAIGEECDPNFHEAVMQTPTSEHPEHTIINELQKGYKMGDKVLRPTLVNVATAE